MRMLRMLAIAMLVLPLDMAQAQTQPITGSISTATPGIGNCVSARAQNNSIVGIDISGTWTGTLQPTVQILSTSSAPTRNKKVTPLDSTTMQATITANGGYKATVAGFTQVNVCASAWTSGTATVTLYAMNGSDNTLTAMGAVPAAGTTGQPAIYNGTNSIGSSAAYFDATAFAGADPCAAISATLTAVANGQRVTAEGFSNTAALASYGATTWPNIKCSVNPFPSTATGSVTLPVGIFHPQAAWVIPQRLDVEARGWDGFPETGLGATSLVACVKQDGTSPGAICNSVVFPAAPGGPMVCWGTTGVCGRGGGSPVFDSPLKRITIDCNGGPGCIAVQDMVCQEGCGLDGVKILNFLNGGIGLEIAGGPTPGANSVTSISGTTVNGSGFTSALVFNQVKFSADVACSGNPCNYTIASINSAGTVITLDTSYTGAACAPCSMTINNSAAQNGYFYNLNMGNGNIAATPATAAGLAIQMNTGSGSNEGPKFIKMVTIVNGNSTAPTDLVRLSGCCTRAEDLHLEGCGVSCFNLAGDAPVSAMDIYNVWTANIAAGTNLILVSSTNAAKNFGFHQIKAVATFQPTNIVNDAQCTHTITVANEPTLEEYLVGSNCVELITTSHTVNSSFSGLNVVAGANGANTFQVFKNDGTTSVIDADTTNGRFGIGNGTPGATLDVAGVFQVAGATGSITKYRNVATAGTGVVIPRAVVTAVSQTAAVTTATLCAAAICGNGAAGQYHVHIDVWGSGTACGTPSPGGATPTLTWTDENAVTHAAVVIPMQSQTGATTMAMNVTAPTVAFQSALANEGGGGDITISTNGTIIQYATAYAACGAGTGTYNIRLTVTSMNF